MTKYREFLRRTALGLSQRNIIQSIGISQKAIIKVQKRAQELRKHSIASTFLPYHIHEIMSPLSMSACATCPTCATHTTQGGYLYEYRSEDPTS